MSSGFKGKNFHKLGLKTVEARQCGMQVCPSGYSFGPFTRDFWLLHFVISGKGVFTNQNGSYTVEKDQIFVIRPYEITGYTADESEPWTYRWIGFTTEQSPPLQLILNDVLTAPFLRELFTAAFERSNFENNSENEAFQYYLCGTVWQIFGLLKRGEEKPHATAEGYVNAAINIMKYEFHTGITVSEIAKRLHIARTYFSEIFKSRNGVSPKRYLDELRMEKAAELMLKHGISITATANSVGYPDVFAFSRAFKRYYKYAPTDYVKRYKTQGTTRPRNTN